MIWDHDRNRKLIDGTEAGQNIWQSSSSMKSKFGVQHVRDAMKSWYFEVKHYNSRNIRSFRFDISVILFNPKEPSDPILGLIMDLRQDTTRPWSGLTLMKLAVDRPPM